MVATKKPAKSGSKNKALRTPPVGLVGLRFGWGAAGMATRAARGGRWLETAAGPDAPQITLAFLQNRKDDFVAFRNN